MKLAFLIASKELDKWNSRNNRLASAMATSMAEGRIVKQLEDLRQKTQGTDIAAVVILPEAIELIKGERMKQFEFWYDEISTYKAGIEAETFDDAVKMLEDAFLHKTIQFFDELPGFWSKDKGFEVIADLDTLIEIEDN